MFQNKIVSNLISPWFTGERKYYAVIGLVFLQTLNLSLAILVYRTNIWLKNFYDILQLKDFHSFIYQLGVFILIGGTYAVITTFHTYCLNMYSLEWRQHLNSSLIYRYHVSRHETHIENPDQRIQEDIRDYTRQLVTLGDGLMYCVMVLILFIPLLIDYSKYIYFGSLHLPYILLILCLGLAFCATYVSVKLGKSISLVSYGNQRAEATYRQHLLIYKLNKFACYTSLFRPFKRVLLNSKQLYKVTQRYGFWANGYDQFTIILPFLVCGYSYFAGLLTLGIMMQLADAFSQTVNSVSYVINQYPQFAALAANTWRLEEFIDKLD